MINKVISTIISCVIVYSYSGFLYSCDVSDTVFFDSSVIKKVINDIHKIKRGGSIELHQLVFSDRHVTDALIAAHAKKVNVTIQISPRLLFYSAKELQRLKEIGINLVYKHTHEKTILLQQKGGVNRIMYSGSWNLSNNAYRQPEILQRFTDKNGDERVIDEVIKIWHNRKQRKKPLQILSPVKRIKQAPKRGFNTPPTSRAFASEVRSPRQVMKDSLRAIRNTPSKKEVIIAIPNSNDKDPKDQTRKNLIAELIEAAQEHPNSSFELIIDEAATRKADLRQNLQELNGLPNGNVQVFNQYGEENTFQTKRGLRHAHIKALVVSATKKSSTPSLFTNSTGNPTGPGGEEPNLTTVTHVARQSAQFLIKRLREIRTTPYSPKHNAKRQKKTESHKK
ncbi:MAG TPA: phospholipase D-like domain-containing protein [Candidatus Babeliales bacterium]|nr:phospholipase D-like domain-containing protein [Candidatus Babeliales bacterium]